ncbi:hypothetical protein H072_7595 [Dactylellina haptotyla CBS 200.50]|uniref:Cell wall protein n=1 Tax=Dactylellina haptotyla (strain CBS 200.50) TaxID=1284197 RepID=S8A6G6_DACHA|nr:hypothetical protein H072_7595 [Dactylellina haptotyla CBS 200.50]
MRAFKVILATALAVFSVPCLCASTVDTVVSDLTTLSKLAEGLTSAADQLSTKSSASEFSQEHQRMTMVFISKHYVFAQFSLTGQIMVHLRRLENAIDSLVSTLIQLVPKSSDSFTIEKVVLDPDIDTAITEFTQICIPSPLYPIVLPICVPSTPGLSKTSQITVS